MATWMQTVGTTLFAAKLSSTVRLRMIAHERRGTHGLLYPAAVGRRIKPAKAPAAWDQRLYRMGPAPLREFSFREKHEGAWPLLARREINLAV